MTTLLIVVLGLFYAYALYIASLSARRAPRPGDFLDGGGSLPVWSTIFAGTGVVLAGLGLYDHFLLTALYGLPYSHVALGLVLVALCAALVQKRLWLAARLSRIASPVELLGAYYGSITIRLFALLVLALFAVPFAAYSLALLGNLIAGTTGGAAPRAEAILVSAFFLFLFSVIGGWRGVIYVVAAQSVLVLVLIAFSGLFSTAAFDSLPFFGSGIATPPGTLADKIPGVLQYSAGIGKEDAAGGIWTTLAIASFAVSLIGIVLSPAFSFLGITTATRSGFAFNQVWMTAGLAGGLLLIVGPMIGAEVAATGPASLAAGGPSYTGLIARFAAVDQIAAICFVLLLAASLQIAVAFFAAAGASVATLDLVSRFILPDLTGEGRRLAARIALAVIYAAIVLMAIFTPTLAVVLGSVTLSLSVQLLPAMLGLCWVPWISRSAVLTGLIVGTLVVLFTEPPGLIAFEGVFLGLPWGRWPLTMHSAAWGLMVNTAFCLIVAVVTRAGPERDHRLILHGAFRRDHRADFGGAAARGASWSLPLIWAFLALGPGAILGNDFFSHPVFSDAKAALGVPSLLVWQIVSWFAGVLLVWWLAYQKRLAIIDGPVRRTVDLSPARGPLERGRVPGWISLSLARLAERGR